MGRTTDFQIDDCELDFGSYCLGGDFALAFEGNGYDFQLIHAFSCGKRMEGPGLDLVKHWMALDLGSPNSRIRRAHQDAIDALTEDDEADNFADWQRDFGPAPRMGRAA